MSTWCHRAAANQSGSLTRRAALLMEAWLSPEPQIPRGWSSFPVAQPPVTKLVRAFSVPLSGGLPEQLPLDRAGRMSFAPGGHAIAYNRIFRNLELRKRYLGGQEQDMYTYDLDTHALTRLTDWKETDTAPMWFSRKIYFVSDRGKNFRQNIWSYDLDTRAFRQLTDFTDYDVDWPSLSASTHHLPAGWSPLRHGPALRGVTRGESQVQGRQ